ncbi:MAG: BlaI/MecI/CopY family transcriptional regulator [Candidatus Woesearchaeota archaeon]|jgi:predicted transcriptional regulator|nr:BlaI/MecI/CopY family transcriptional regulator [Candidatus Woesearchaeota archaeon]MDP7198535.1 BlaI/MecI/CopY family transcriptional regulator [Candidatus Woesearchaeota archaeon]MDP7466723.1 BlaI/MecI/CopY family transcriptional regulator [Candidatus Woesearchaeota archaeon]MDP7647174.1 BlaI/MecI/CopY family transcriptional regulator [Candidatus Woesearchaeota archaeon]|tara:strand:+ start:213 stop:554 length:342 start_codon:yes stop_codon:yes gene_type:complete
MKRVRVDKVFSPLEHDVLQILWRQKSLRVRQIFDQLKKKRKVALSSVAVILDRLHSKKIVTRTIEKARGGVRYVYSVAEEKSQFEQQQISNVVDQLVKKFGNTAVAYFQERFK